MKTKLNKDPNHKNISDFNEAFPDKPPEKRSQSKLMGLKNQGATCYLNSLIQSFYMTPDLRRGLFAIDPESLGFNPNHETIKDSETSIDNIQQNDSLSNRLIGSAGEKTIVKNSIPQTNNAPVEEKPLETLTNMKSSDLTEVNKSRKNKTAKPRWIPIEFQKLFTNMQMLDVDAISTEELTNKGFQWRNTEGQVQHDAHELNRLLIDALEKSLRKTSGENLCQKLYQGMLVNKTKCLHCNQTSEKYESFYDILLQVKGYEDLVTSLRDYTSAELLSGTNKYLCDSGICKGTKQEAYRSAFLKTFPTILTFSCQRFDIDRSSWERYKVVSKFEFPIILNVHKFQKSADRGNPLPKYEGTKEQDYVADIKKSCLWAKDIYEDAQEIIKKIMITNPDLNVNSLEQLEIVALKKQFLSKCLPRSENLDPLKDLEKCDGLYQLHAIIMHRGTAFSGHYFAYIRDSLGEGNWELPKDNPEDTDVNKKYQSSEKKFFYREVSRDGKEIYVVNSDSPLGFLVSIFLEIESRSLSPYKLSILVKQKLGKTWIEYFNNQGALNMFLKTYTDIFETSTYLIKLVADTRLVDEEEFLDIILSGTKKLRSARNKQKESKVAIPISDLIPSMAEILIQRIFGSFFLFDDERVVPIKLKDTLKALEGEDSAYLLIYRRVHFDKIDQSSSSNSSSRGSSSSSSSSSRKSKALAQLNSIPVPPRLWSNTASQTNSKLERYRSDYNNFIISKKKNIDEFPLSDKNLAEGLSIELNYGSLVSELSKEFILKLLIDNDNDNANANANGENKTVHHIANSLDFVGISDSDSWCISQLAQCEDGCHVLTPFPFDSTIKEALVDRPMAMAMRTKSNVVLSNYVLIWNGSRIGSTPLEAKQFDLLPTRYQVNLLSKESSNQGKPNLLSIGALWMRDSIKLPDVCLKVQNLITAKNDTQCNPIEFDISLLFRSKKSRGHDAGIHYLYLFKNKCFYTESHYIDGIEHKLKNLSLGSFNSTEILIARPGKNKNDISIFDQEVHFRNKFISIQFVCLFDVENINSINATHNLEAKIPDTFEQNFTRLLPSETMVKDLIFDVLELIKVPECLSPYFKILYNGHDMTETNLSLTEFGVENNGTIHVEITKTIAEVHPKQIMMKICRVENNDPKTQKVSASTRGYRTKTVELLVDCTESVSSLKIKAFKLLGMNISKDVLSPNETGQGQGQRDDLVAGHQKMLMSHRFRLTTWAEEPSHLLEEFEFAPSVHSSSSSSSSSSSTSSSAAPAAAASDMVESLLPVEIISNGLKDKTVDSIPGIHENSFLLLEDGEPFIKGACFIKLYLWQPSLSNMMGGKMISTHGEKMSCDREEEKQITVEDQGNLHQKKKKDSPYHAKTQPNGSTHSAKDKEVIILNTPQQEQEQEHHHLFTELGPLTCSRDETVQNLYEKVANMIYNKRQEIFSDVLNDNIVIEKDKVPNFIVRLFNDINLPGIIYHRVLPDHDKDKDKDKAVNDTLKSLGIKRDSHLIVQFLEPQSQETQPPLAKAKFWIQHLKHPYSSSLHSEPSSQMETDLLWPPIEFDVSFTLEYPTLGLDLLKTLSKKALSFPEEITLEHIRIFKYHPKKLTWNEIKQKSTNGNTNKKASKGSNAGSSNNNSNLSSLKTGDLLCAFYNENNQFPSDDSAKRLIIRSPPINYLRSRVENVESRAVRLPPKKRKRVSAFEIALKIGSDLDFSSDELED